MIKTERERERWREGGVVGDREQRHISQYKILRRKERDVNITDDICTVEYYT